jgi:hypothetical protein
MDVPADEARELGPAMGAELTTGTVSTPEGIWTTWASCMRELSSSVIAPMISCAIARGTSSENSVAMTDRSFRIELNC